MGFKETQFEDLQAIWDTQNDRPAFSMNDSRLAVGLYQQREQSRRRLFRLLFAPAYVTALFITGALGLTFLVFLLKTVTKLRLTDPQMSIWDGAALAAAVGAALAVVAPMYRERRKHEGTQNVFAPSLREELERGISQLDFELGCASWAWRIPALVSLGTCVLLWELGRLNGQSPPWTMLAVVLSGVATSVWAGLAANKKVVEQIEQRRRALESMRAALEENAL
jgi:ABC-type Fe3+-siderophore transport system permease subunit